MIKVILFFILEKIHEKLYRQNQENIEKRKIKTLEKMLRESQTSTFRPEIDENSDRIMKRRSNSVTNFKTNNKFEFETIREKNAFLNKVEMLRKQKQKHIK